MDESKDAERARGAKAELAEILERRPDLHGKSLEAVKRILRREARLSLTSENLEHTKVSPNAPAVRREAEGEEEWGKEKWR